MGEGQRGSVLWKNIILKLKMVNSAQHRVIATDVSSLMDRHKSHNAILKICT
jgi:hypothetical protein